MAAELTVEIVTFERAAFAGSASEVVLPGYLGELGVLPGHLPLVTLLRSGELTAKTADGARSFAIGSGFAEVLPDKVTILVRHCCGADDVDIEHAKAELEALTKALDKGEFDSEREMEEHLEEAARHRARLSIVDRATRG